MQAERRFLRIIFLIAVVIPLVACRSSQITSASVQDTSSDEQEALSSEQIAVFLEQNAVQSTDAVAKWYDSYFLVAHALGSVDGRTETNSLEAFLQSYDKGQRVFEADFSMTSDNHLVVRHDFEDITYYNLEQVVGDEYVMDYDTYMSQRINYLYTPLDVDGLIALLVEYPDTYLITDSKSTDKENVQAEFKLLVDCIERSGDVSLYERIIVQIYHDDMYSYVSEIYPFTNWIYTTYQLSDPNYEAVAQFCVINDIDVIVSPIESASVNINSLVHAYGLKMYYHTVNRAMTMVAHWSMGADGFYTDFITPTEIYSAELR